MFVDGSCLTVLPGDEKDFDRQELFPEEYARITKFFVIVPKKIAKEESTEKKSVEKNIKPMKLKKEVI